MTLEFAASQYKPTVLLWVAGQPERSKYAAHCRQLPGRLMSAKFVCLRYDRGGLRQCTFADVSDNGTSVLQLVALGQVSLKG